MSSYPSDGQKSSDRIKQTTLNGGIATADVGCAGEDARVCDRCGAVEDLHTHHVKYIPEETVTLCATCHNDVHSSKWSSYEPEQDPNDLFETPSADSAVPEHATVTVKQINDNSYFYWNWRDGDDVRSEYICPVAEARQHPLFEGDVEE